VKTWFEDGDERFVVAAVVLCEGCLAVLEASRVWFREVCKTEVQRSLTDVGLIIFLFYVWIIHSQAYAQT